MNDIIYLDYCSTTPIDRNVALVMHDYLLRGYANPNSQHRPGQDARRELERLRSDALLLLGGNTRGMTQDQLITTSGGTESNHLAVLGLLKPERPRLLVSAVEHPGVIGAASIAVGRGVAVRQIPVDRDGVVRLDCLEQLLVEEPTSLVSLMLVNNETGVIQPVAETARICHQHGSLIHTDAVQAIGRLPVSFNELRVDAMTVAAHKFYGPRGIGGLVLRHGVDISPLMVGGSQQMGWRPGTEDVALMAGMHAALSKSVGELSTQSVQTARLRDDFEERLVASVRGVVEFNGAKANRSGHVSNVSFPGLDRQAVLLAADLAGLAISTGSACASGSSEPSPVLLAMNLESVLIEGALRFSFGVPTTQAEVVHAVERISRIVNGLRTPK